MGHIVPLMKRSRTGQILRSAARSFGRVAPGVYQAAKWAKRAYGTYNKYNAKSATSTPPISFQHDSAVQYRRRRAPKRVKRRMRKITKQWNYMTGKALGQYSRVFNYVFAPATITPLSLASSQTVFDTILYGGDTVNAWNSRLFEICQDLLNSQSTAKVYFKSAVLDVQIRNVDPNSPLICDVYKVVARREGYDSPGAEWAQAATNQVVTSGSNVLTPLHMNATPFDAPGFGSYWLILQKVRYRIGPGSSVYFTLKDPRNYEFDTARFNYDSGASLNRTRYFKGLSKGYIFVGRSSSLDATNQYSGQVNWQITTTQSYHYAVNSGSFDQSGAN